MGLGLGSKRPCFPREHLLRRTAVSTLCRVGSRGNVVCCLAEKRTQLFSPSWPFSRWGVVLTVLGPLSHLSAAVSLEPHRPLFPFVSSSVSGRSGKERARWVGNVVVTGLGDGELYSVSKPGLSGGQRVSGGLRQELAGMGSNSARGDTRRGVFIRFSAVPERKATGTPLGFPAAGGRAPRGPSWTRLNV